MDGAAIQLKWVADRIAGAFAAVCGSDGASAPFPYCVPVCGADFSETRIAVCGGVSAADVLVFRVVPEEIVPFRFLADAPGLAELCLTVYAEIRTVFRRVRRIFPCLFRIVPFNLRHLYRRERILRL